MAEHKIILSLTTDDDSATTDVALALFETFWQSPHVLVLDSLTIDGEDFGATIRSKAAERAHDEHAASVNSGGRV